MKLLQVALYARVSSDQQAEAHTIASQVAALRAQITADGLALPAALAFLDDGYSGTNLQRPALDRLRDAAAAHQIDRLYVLCPDRLARNYAYQVLLLDELTHAGVEVRFLNHPGGATPEDQLLLQVQGVIAAYERAKFLERSRRGKRYAAQAGQVSVLGHAPYGYHYVSAPAGAGAARFEILDTEAAVVRQIFIWVGQERLSINDVRRRLQAAGIATRLGKAVWDPKTLWELLHNPAYKGQAAFGRRRRGGPLPPRLRTPRGRPPQSKRGYVLEQVPEKEWISIPVPALVEDALFTAAAQQLQENRQRRRMTEQGNRYLLQGLLVCAECGYAYHGQARKGRNTYYRCGGSLPTHGGGVRVCWNKTVRMDQLDQAIWAAVGQVLEEPERVADEYRQRAAPPPASSEQIQVERQLGKVTQGVARLIDSYAAGLIEQQEFEPRVRRLHQQREQLEQQQAQWHAQAQTEEELRGMVDRLAGFAGQVRAGLEHADWATRRDLIRTLVKQVEMEREQVRVVFRISPLLRAGPADGRSPLWQHYGGRVCDPHGTRRHLLPFFSIAIKLFTRSYNKRAGSALIFGTGVLHWQ